MKQQIIYIYKQYKQRILKQFYTMKQIMKVIISIHIQEIIIFFLHIFHQSDYLPSYSMAIVSFYTKTIKL